MTWREKAAPIIAEVLAETKGRSDSDIRKALRKAFPFGARQYFPYKVWLDEIKCQRGLKVYNAKAPQPKNENQLELI